ncbi:hypothetical protein C8R43DRAFT_958898 [Mycena crocata]|nr:hypothetical protein C8R43DRAFT_958898 [Mycena crocata]
MPSCRLPSVIFLDASFYLFSNLLPVNHLTTEKREWRPTCNERRRYALRTGKGRSVIPSIYAYVPEPELATGNHRGLAMVRLLSSEEWQGRCWAGVFVTEPSSIHQHLDHRNCNSDPLQMREELVSDISGHHMNAGIILAVLCAEPKRRVRRNIQFLEVVQMDQIKPIIIQVFRSAASYFEAVKMLVGRKALVDQQVPQDGQLAQVSETVMREIKRVARDVFQAGELRQELEERVSQDIRSVLHGTVYTATPERRDATRTNEWCHFI